MAARLTTQTPAQRPARSEACELAEASGPRPEAILALLAAALIFMTVPAVLTGMSIVDSSMPARSHGWVQEVSAWLTALGHARLVLTLPLAAMVERAKEDS